MHETALQPQGSLKRMSTQPGAEKTLRALPSSKTPLPWLISEPGSWCCQLRASQKHTDPSAPSPTPIVLEGSLRNTALRPAGTWNLGLFAAVLAPGQTSP